MDKIEFKIEQNNTEFNINVYLNDKNLGDYVFNLLDVLSLIDIEKAMFDLFTCGCGTPECAGFYDEVIHSQNSKNVYWLFPKEYKTDKKMYVFDKNVFVESLNKLKEKVMILIGNGLIPSSLNEEDNYGCEDKKLKDKFQDFLTNTKAFFKKESDILKLIDENTPFYNDVHIDYYNYGILVNKCDLVFAMLNEYPSLTNEDGFEDRVLKATNALNQWVLNNDFTLVKDLDNQAYSDLYENKEINHLFLLNRFTFINKAQDEMSLYFDVDCMYFGSESEKYPEHFSMSYFKVSI